MSADRDIEQAQTRVRTALSRLADGLPVDLAPLEGEVRAISLAVQAIADQDGIDAARRLEPALTALAESLEGLEAELVADHQRRLGPRKD